MYPGGTNWNSPAFNPATGLFYVTARETCATFYSWQQDFIEDRDYFGGTGRNTGRGSGAVRAIDPLTGQIKWESKQFTPSMSGMLTTASGLVQWPYRQDPLEFSNRRSHLRGTSYGDGRVEATRPDRLRHYPVCVWLARQLTQRSQEPLVHDHWSPFNYLQYKTRS
jgi:hypothetical protein